MGRFTKKVILVTGGTSGMGLKTAEYFAQEGGEVFVSGRNEQKGKEAIQYIKDKGHKIEFVKCDVSQSQDVKQMITSVVEKGGKLDVAFNNAGITSKKAIISESDEQDWMQVININLIGTYLCMKYETEQMMKNSGGIIVNNSSIAGLIPTPLQSAYISSKAGVIGLTRCTAIEYAQKNIRINAIAPGPVMGGMNTEEKLKANPESTERKLNITAMHRFAEPEEVANTVLWLSSEESSYITGVVIPVDGGCQAGKW